MDVPGDILIFKFDLQK